MTQDASIRPSIEGARASDLAQIAGGVHIEIPESLRRYPDGKAMNARTYNILFPCTGPATERMDAIGQTPWETPPR